MTDATNEAVSAIIGQNLAAMRAEADDLESLRMLAPCVEQVLAVAEHSPRAITNPATLLGRGQLSTPALRPFLRSATDAAVEAFLSALRASGVTPFPEQADALRRFCNKHWGSGYTAQECGYETEEDYRHANS